MKKKKILTLTLPLTLLFFNTEPKAKDYSIMERDPFLQGGCLIPDPLGLAGVNIQATIDVKKNGKVKYSLITNEKSKDAKLILDKIIKCPITIGTQQKRKPEDSPIENVDGSFYFSFTPINLDSRKGFSKCFSPHYPYMSLTVMQQGITELQFKIDSQTNTSEIRIKKGSGTEELDNAGIEHAKNCLGYDEVKADIEKNIWIDRRYNWVINSPSK